MFDIAIAFNIDSVTYIEIAIYIVIAIIFAISQIAIFFNISKPYSNFISFFKHYQTSVLFFLGRGICLVHPQLDLPLHFMTL